MSEAEPPRVSLKERMRSTAVTVFSAADHLIDTANARIGQAVDTLSRVRVIVSPSEEDARKRRDYKYATLAPYVSTLPLHVIETALDLDLSPIEARGQVFPSQYEDRLVKGRIDEIIKAQRDVSN